MESGVMIRGRKAYRNGLNKDDCPYQGKAEIWWKHGWNREAIEDLGLDPQTVSKKVTEAVEKARLEGRGSAGKQTVEEYKQWLMEENE